MSDMSSCFWRGKLFDKRLRIQNNKKKITDQQNPNHRSGGGGGGCNTCTFIKHQMYWCMRVSRVGGSRPSPGNSNVLISLKGNYQK